MPVVEAVENLRVCVLCVCVEGYLVGWSLEKIWDGLGNFEEELVSLESLSRAPL